METTGEIQVKDLYHYWIGIKEVTVRPNTVRNYRERYEKNIKSDMEKMGLKDVKPLHCQKILNKMAECGYAESTIKQTRITMSNMFDFAVQNDLLSKNPCNKAVKANIGKEVTKKEAMTISQQQKFLVAIKGNIYEDQYAFLLQTGLRTGEMMGLRWGDIDFEAGLLRVRQTLAYNYRTGEWKVGPPKSRAGYRSVPLTEAAAGILRRRRESLVKSGAALPQWRDYVFLGETGEPTKNSAYDAMLYKLCDRSGIPRFSMHALRHTFATRCIEAGMKPKTLQTILGHSNISVTMNLYVHTTEEEKIKEMQSVQLALLLHRGC